MKCNGPHPIAPAAPAPTQPAPTAVSPTPLPPAEPPTPRPAPTATVSAASKPTPPIAVSPTITEMVKLADITMYYASYGKGEPLILLHGAADSADIWAKHVPALAELYRVITPDNRAQGRTTDSETPWSYHLMAEDIRQLMDHLAIDRAYIVGWSDGAKLGLDLAINHPDRVRALVSYGATTSPDGIQPGPRSYMRDAPIATLTREFGAEYLRLSATPERLPVVAEKIRNLLLTQPNFTAKELGAIKSPTAIVSGTSEEWVVPGHAEEIAHAIPNAELIRMPNGLHDAPIAMPEEFNQIVLDFLKDK